MILWKVLGDNFVFIATYTIHSCKVPGIQVGKSDISAEVSSVVQIIQEHKWISEKSDLTQQGGLI